MTAQMKDQMDHRTLIEQGYIWTNAGWAAGPLRIAALRRTYAANLTDSQCSLLSLIGAYGEQGYALQHRGERQDCARLMDLGYVVCESRRPNMHITAAGEVVVDLITSESANDFTIFFNQPLVSEGTA